MFFYSGGLGAIQNVFGKLGMKLATGKGQNLLSLIKCLCSVEPKQTVMAELYLQV